MLPVRFIVGLPSDARKIHPTRFTLVEPGLYSSIHSSFVDAAVPAQATSLMITLRKPAGVEVAVRVGVTVVVGVMVTVGVIVSVRVMVGVGVIVSVGVIVDVCVIVGVSVGGGGTKIEFCCLGVPLMKFVPTSTPFLVIPSLNPQLVSISTPILILSMVKKPGPVLPPIQAPPSIFAVSITLFS